MHDARSDILCSINISNILIVIAIHMHELRYSEVYRFFFCLELIAIRSKIILFIGNSSKESHFNFILMEPFYVYVYSNGVFGVSEVY